MNTQTRTEEQRINELVEMRQRIAELEKVNTERKQVEELFKSLTSSSPIGIYVVQDGKFQFVNAQFQKYAGYREDELLGMDSLSFVFPDERNRVRENAVKMLKGERSIPYEYQFVNKEGEVRWIMETVVPIQYLGRRAALGNFMDITERKRVEEALRESEEKYRTVLEDIEEGYFEVDIAGNFTFFNDPMCGIIGYSRDEMMGMNNRQYMDKENARKVYQAFNRVYTTGKPSKEFGWEIIRKDGTKRFTEASVSLKRNSEGEPIGFQGIVRDITERKRAEEKIEHLNTVLRAIRNVNQLITREKDSKRLIKGTCNELVETRGYFNAWITLLDESGRLVSTAEAGLGKDFKPMVEMLKRGELTDCGRNALKQSGVIIVEDPLSTYVDCPLAQKYGDGGAMTVRLEYGGNVYGLMSVSIPRDLAADEEEQALFREVAGDIAFALHNMKLEEERRQAEEALQESQEKIRNLFESVTDGIFAIDLNGAYTEVNERMLEMHGFSSKDEILGENAFEFVAPDIDRTAMVDMKRTLEQGSVASLEYTVVRTDGSEFPAEVNAKMLKDASGNPVGFIGSIRDITERKQAEEALRESEEKLRLIFESINDAVAVTDLEGNLVQVNEAAVRMTGYSNKEELLGRNMLESIIAKKNRARIIEDMAKTLEEGHALGTRSYTLLAADGREFDAEFSTAVLRDSSGNVIRLIGVARDITERKRTEEELRKHREHLEELVAARTKELQDAQERLVRTEKLAVIGQLAGGVSHELRNPLGAIKNASYFLNMAIEQPEPEVKETLEILQKEVATSERIISSLLDFARPKTATLQNVHINEVIEESLCRVTVPENVEVVRHLDETLPIILADPGQLGQVFTNIILNAIQAMPEGGQLVLKSAVPSRGWAAVSFTDTGAGISEENLEKLFEPLFTTKAKGIGLGLAICRTMVEAHGGTIEVQSTEGKGSTFTISLPVGKKEKQ